MKLDDLLTGLMILIRIVFVLIVILTATTPTAVYHF